MKNRKTIFTTILFVLACFGFLPGAKAVVPAPDGGYPGGNTAEGQNALLNLTTGGFNTAVGYLSLRSNTIGGFNTAIGAGALLANVGDPSVNQGVENTATGAGALLSNTAGGGNTANGAFALFSNTTGLANAANGDAALANNTTGNFNTASSTGALLNNTSGSGNTAIGYNAGFNATTGSNNVYIGAFMNGVAGESNHTYIDNINTTTVSGGGTDTVTVNLSTGLLGHLSSSRRYKEEIKPLDKASEVLFDLKPVSYRFKKEIDQSQSLDYGLIAEEVAEVDPNLAIRDGKGQIESVRYNAVNAMLLNEFLKEHRTVQELKAIIAQLKQDFQSKLSEQQKQIEALTAGLQKVSAHLELTRRPTQMVLSDR